MLIIKCKHTLLNKQEVMTNLKNISYKTWVLPSLKLQIAVIVHIYVPCEYRRIYHYRARLLDLLLLITTQNTWYQGIPMAEIYTIYQSLQYLNLDNLHFGNTFQLTKTYKMYILNNIKN